MSYYVIHSSNGRFGYGYKGPMRTLAHAEREAAAWQGAGHAARVLPATPVEKTNVRHWLKQVRQARS